MQLGGETLDNPFPSPAPKTIPNVNRDSYPSSFSPEIKMSSSCQGYRFHYNPWVWTNPEGARLRIKVVYANSIYEDHIIAFLKGHIVAKYVQFLDADSQQTD